MGKIRFNALTPVNLTEELEPYKDALDFSLDMTKTDITNIAITGGYGAGKSSVIKSYIQEKGIQKKALNISLASFELKNGRNSNKLDLETIELKILQHLIHQVHPSKLPKSRFERIEHDAIEWDKTFYHTVVSIGFIFVITVFISNVFFNKELIPPNYPFYLFSLFVTGCFLFSFSTYLVNKGVFSKQEIESIDLLSGKAVFKESKATSPLSLFLDEILYFFEVTDYSIVVFEDLDRLEHIEILTRLRELNELINSSGQVKRPIKFIYAVKDDLFEKPEDRVKFFDFIIPIIPVMDFENSFQHLRKGIFILGGESLLNILDQGHLLRDISLYLRDKRLLNNTLNEYQIYLIKDKSGIEIENSERLKKIFALIVYKNFMPEDFGKIKERQSILCKIVEEYRNKTKLSEIRNKWQKELLEKREEIRNLESVQNQDIDDLKVKFIDDLLFPISWQSQIKDNRGNSFTKEDKVKFFNSKIARDTIISKESFTINNDTYYSPAVDKNTVNKSLDKFENQKAYIQQNKIGKQDQLRREIKELRSHLEKYYTLSEVIRLYREYVDSTDDWQKDFIQEYSQINAGDGIIQPAEGEVENQKKVGNQSLDIPIIFMLIRRGYIDQSYINYLSLSPNSTEELVLFRKALADNRPYTDVFDLEISDELLSLFLKEDEDIFKDHAVTESILNFSLILYLLKNKEQKNSEYLKSILDFHFNRKDRFNLSFLKGFILESLIRNRNTSIEKENDVPEKTFFLDNAKLFISSIFKQNSESLDSFLSVIQPEELVDPSEDLKNIMLLILVVVKDDLSKITSTNIERLKSLLRSIEGYVNQFNDVIADKEKHFINGWLEQLGITVELSQPDDLSDKVAVQLFQDFISISAYEITKQNIIEIFRFFNKDEEKLLAQNYTAIIENFARNTDFRKYIEANISQYVNDILLKQKLGVMESNEAMIALINNKLLSNDQRMGLIKQHESICFGNDFDQIEFEDILCRVENDSSFSQDLFDLDIRRRKEGKSLINATWDNAYWGIYSNETITKELQNDWLMIACNEVVNSDFPADEGRLDQLKELIAFNNDLNFESYSVLMEHLDIVLESEEDLEKISQFSWDKIEFLMKQDFIAVSPSAIQTIYDNHIKEEDDE